MAGKANTLSKKTIIAIATIIVLLLIAGISVGIFLADKGKTEAVDNKEVAENRIDNENKDNNDEKQDPSVQNPENQGNKNNQTPNTDGNQTANNNQTTNNNQTANNNQTTNNNATNNNTNRNNENNSTANNTQTTGNNGTTNNGVTTGTNVNEVGETTITRVEEGEEKVVAKKFWDWWNPMSVVVASTTANINAEKPEIVVEKSATTEAGENLVYAGEQIKYTINVTNNSKKDVENIEVTDKIPANTTFASINNDGTTITEGNDIVGVKWVISIPAGETKTVEFTVTVNQTMVDENGETVETKGIINNKAIANGEESNEVKTSIIKSKKTSAILRDKEQVEKAKIGDTIIYYISVENTGDVAGTTTITDYVPEGTELKSNVLRGGNVINDEKGTKVEWKDIEVPAGKTKTVFFMVEVKDIDGIIRNVATVGGKDTNEEDVGTTDIEIIKNVTDIKRNGVSIGKDAKVQAEDVIEYELVVTNTGSEKLTNVVVTDELAGIELTDGKWIIGDLASKEQKTIKAKYTVKYEKDIKGNAEKTVTNYAVVTGTSVPVIPEETPEEVSDDDDVTTPVEDTPKLEIEKTSTAVNGKPIVEGKTKVRAGDIIEYTITVKNTGNVELKDVIVTDNNTVRVGDTTYTVEEGAENVVIKTIPSIAVGETAEVIKAYYTVTENDVKEAGKIYNLATATSEKTTDEDDDDNVVVNENTTVTAKKVWEDNNNQDGIRPNSIELTLYADGVEYKDEKTNQTVKVTVIPEQKSDKEWSYVFEGLPTYNKDGGKIKYTIVETNIGAEYKTTYSQDGLTVTNTHEPYTVDIDITKVWVDNDNQDGKRSQTVTVNLKKGETVIGEAKELSEANSWTGKWENLPKYENGTLIDYNVEEVGTIDGYTVTVSPAEKEKVKEITNNVYSYTITNTHEVEKTSVTVNKEWVDGNNQDGKRPSSITVKLLADGNQAKDANNNDITATITPDANGDWTYTFTNLDKYKAGQLINYTVSEDAVDGYTTSTPESLETTENGYVGTITNTHEVDKTSLDVRKEWNDDSNRDGKRPSSITVRLLAGGVQAKDANNNDITATITPDASGNWEYTFANLDKYKAGQLIDYTVSEDAVENYTTTYKKENGKYEIINSYEPETTSVSVEKIWNDDGNRDGKRSGSITVALLKNGNQVDTATITPDDNGDWKHTFIDLEKYEDQGKLINYTVKEVKIPEYNSSVKKVENKFTITNTHDISKTEIEATKAWDDNDDQDGKRPDSVTLILLADGKRIDSQVVNEDNGWTAKFTNLPVYNNGKTITYTVDEENIAPELGYTKHINGTIVTNSRTPETTSVTVNKEWHDEGNQDGKRPDSITVRLLADGTKVKDATITPDNSGNWTYTWSGLAKYKAGQLINYTVLEDAVDGYTTSIPTSLGTTTNGYVGTITNTHEIEKTSVTVNKEWIDGNNQDGIRPDSVNITLDATITNTNGEKENVTIPGTVTRTITLNEGNTWTYTWAGLDKYKNGKEIKYTVAENNEDERYTVSIKQNNKTTANGYDYTVTNSYTPEKTSVKVNKVWTDADNQDGIRPDSVSITLTATITNTNGEKENVTIPGTVTRTITLNEGNKWAYTWSGLDKNKAGQKIEYTVVENNVKTGYSVSVVPNNQTAENGYDYTVTNSHTPETTSVTVNKEWNDDSNRDGKRPGSITVRLLADGNQAKDANNNDLIATITPDNSGNWTYTWSGLAKYKAGQKINYTVSENTVENYNENNEQQPEITLEEKTENSYVYKIKNTHTPETINIPVTKEWKDNDYIEARGDKIIVDLYAGTSKVKTIAITSANGWKGAFNDLPKYKAGKLIEYSIKERAVDRYITSITGNSETGFTITNKYQNVIVNKNVVKSVMNEEKFNSKLDFVFVIDTSGSMNEKYNNVKKAQTMVNALNSTMATILENENNRVGVVGYSSAYGGNESHSSVILGLDYYTAENNEFINLEEGYNSTYIQANAKNSSGTNITNYRYVEGATYTQAGIRDGANLLINSSHEEGRIPVIILLTDGEPTRSTQYYSNVGGYNRNNDYGDGRNSTSKSAFYTIMSAKHYKVEVNKAYKTKTNTDIARFFTIGIGMDTEDLYANTLLNPYEQNVTDCSKSNSWTKTYGIYNLMKQNYENILENGKNTFKNDKLNYYSYSDGAFIGNMDEEKLKNILKKTMESIKTYEKETTKTTNIDVDTAIIELEHLDIEKKIEIKINGEATEYTVQELKDNNVVTQTGSKYYMDLNADMFKNKKTIEITYYQVSLLNN